MFVLKFQKENTLNCTFLLEWTDDDMTAQAILFFFAGFDSSATLLCFLANELAINTDVQKKLQQEIDELYEKNNKLEYNDLQNMKYMDMVVSGKFRTTYSIENKFILNLFNKLKNCCVNGLLDHLLIENV